MINWSSLFAGAYPWQGTMPVLEVSGEPYEMGFAHGETCKVVVQKVAEDFIGNLVKVTGVKRSRIIEEALQYEKAILEQLGDEYIQEMKGIAAGAEVDYQDVLVMNCGWDLLNSLPTPETHPGYMCSSFSAFGEDTLNGDLVTGHNDDGARNIDQFLVLMKASPARGRSFAAPVVPGYIGYHRMWNDSGTVIFGLSLENGCKNDEFEHNLPMWVLQRYLIQYKESTEEVVNGFGEHPPATAFNFLISDAGHEVRVGHMTAKHQLSFGPEGSTAVLTNHALVDEIKPHLVMREHPSSTDYRYQTVKEIMEEERGKIGVETGKKALGSHRDASTGRVHPSPNTPCAHHEYEGRMVGTVSTVVIELKEDRLEAHVSLGNPCEGRWITDIMPIRK